MEIQGDHFSLERCEAVFNVVDVNQNGFIEPEEYEQIQEARMLYAARVSISGSRALQGLCQADGPWRRALVQDLHELWESSGERLQELPDPRLQPWCWEEMWRAYPSQWRAMVKKWAAQRAEEVIDDVIIVEDDEHSRVVDV